MTVQKVEGHVTNQNSKFKIQNSYDLSVIIVNYNGLAVLTRCLQAVDRSTDGLKIQTVLVDNGSQDGSSYLPCCYKADTHIVRLNKNVGFSRANNIGIQEARGRYYLLLNTDCFIQPGLLSTLVRCLDKRNDTAIIGPRLLNEDGTLQPSCHNFPSPPVFLLEQSLLWKLLRLFPLSTGKFLQIASAHKRPGEVDWLSGACMLVRPEAFKQVDGFDSGFFFYWEEADLCMRLRQRGWKTRFEPSVCAIHLGGGSTAAGRMVIAFFKSLYRFYAKNYSPCQLIKVRAIVRFMSLLKATRSGYSALRGDHSRNAKIRQAHMWLRVSRL